MDAQHPPSPNHATEDPRGKDIGQGYPEENQAGTSPHESPDRSGGPAPIEGDPGKATGNPNAAGARPSEEDV